MVVLIPNCIENLVNVLENVVINYYTCITIMLKNLSQIMISLFQITEKSH